MHRFAKEIKKGMSSNTFLSLSSKAVAMVFFLLTDLGAARILGKQNYGEWSFFYAVITMCIWVGWFGINTSSRVFIARSQDDYVEQNSWITGSIWLRLIISIAVCTFILTMTVIAKSVFEVMNHTLKYPHLLFLFFIGAFHVFANTFVEFFKEAFVGLVQFRKVFVLTLLEYAGYLIFGIGFLLLWNSVYALELGYLAACTISSLVGLVLIRYRLRSFSDKREKRSYIKPIFRYSLPLLLTSIGQMLMLEIDTFMIGILYSGEEVAIYSIAKSLSSKATHINYAICTSVLVGFSIINNSNHIEKKQKYSKIMKYNVLIIFWVGAGLMLFSPLAIRILYGIEYIQSALILRLLIPYYALYSFSIFDSTFLDYQQKARQKSLYFMIMLVLNIILNVTLIPTFGAVGAAIATDISMIPYVVLLYIARNKFFALSQ